MSVTLPSNWVYHADRDAYWDPVTRAWYDTSGNPIDGAPKVPPGFTDADVEREIQAKSLTAPRVTPQRIEEVIAGEYYFNAQQAADVAHGGNVDHPRELGLLTFCVLVLKNGFTVTGESACASPENFNAELGRKLARRNAVNKIWPLEGYLLRQRLHEMEDFEKFRKQFGNVGIGSTGA